MSGRPLENRADWPYRLAARADIAALTPLMHRSISELLSPHLPVESVEASFEIMGLDTQLIDDGTYYAVLDGETIVGCGGWSRRATLFGGDHSAGRDTALLDPRTDAARVRAMYTHPDWTRRGIGRFILSLCETAAAREGFRRCELVATLAGEPLYSACGYELIERFESATSSGVRIPLLRMAKALP